MDDYDFLTFNKNTVNLNRYKHIFEGDVTGGWYYYPTGAKKPGNEILNVTKGVKGQGVYEANVKINGVEKTSTFFPDEWSEKEVLENINNAFNNKRGI